MSIEARYFSNGKKAAYVLLNTETREAEEFQRKEDIPESAQHLFQKLNRPRAIGPNLAMLLGVNKIFYPDWPKMCTAPCNKGRTCMCAGENCMLASTPIGWRTCPFIKDRKEENE